MLKPRLADVTAQLAYTDLIDRPRGRRRKLLKVSPQLYCAVVIVTGSLALLQFLFLPNNLGSVEFGYAVLGLSVVQAGLQLADLGMVNASLRSDLAAQTRVALRTSAVSVGSIICIAGIIVCSVVALGGHTWALVAAAALACALWLIGDRAHASAAVQRGDEQTTTRYNVIWQNAPKLGTIVGSFGGSALSTMLGAIATSLLFSRPQLPRRLRWQFLRTSRHLWLPGFAVSLSAFLLTWTETYLLSALIGIDEAGQYQAVVRPLTGITYLYLPIVALIQAAHNAEAHRRELILTAIALGLGVVGSAVIAAVLCIAGPAIWSGFAFEPEVVAAAAVASSAICAATVTGTQLLLRGHHVAAATNAVLGAVVLIAVSVLTVESMGARGAAIASASAWSVVTICHIVFLAAVRLRRRSDLT